ncbi:hypothetical protein QBC33DRAFT_604168 [Phialemonium atrogriseum]|uniref:Uncharacterized protein n=1 Tax=Phialemonium atrogriseum TaxID=1093897 RepID=A0AAJ0C660_9PEZI|nr:uncharacterized protein QBC33DRAFT_604168 [Phialemonium atrogriseum]KAK1769447.1 hypothetical protein QBC33DRAFT_604168 [Phialemonium atrogriseum]
MSHSSTSSITSRVKRRIKKAALFTPSEGSSNHKTQALPPPQASGAYPLRRGSPCNFRTRLGGLQVPDEETDFEEAQPPRLPLEYTFVAGRQLSLIPEESEESDEEPAEGHEDDNKHVFGGFDDDDSIYDSLILATLSEILALEDGLDERLPASSDDTLPAGDPRPTPTRKPQEFPLPTYYIKDPKEDPTCDPGDEFYLDVPDSWSVVTSMSGVSTYMPGCVMEQPPSRFPRLTGLMKGSSRAAKKKFRKVESTCRGMMLPRKLCSSGALECLGVGA